MTLKERLIHFVNRLARSEWELGYKKPLREEWNDLGPDLMKAVELWEMTDKSKEKWKDEHYGTWKEGDHDE